MSRRRTGEGGFTLMEILISLVVMVIGLVGVMMIQVAAVRGNRQAGRFTRAAMLAEQTMEDLRGKKVETLETEQGLVGNVEIGGIVYEVVYTTEQIAGQPNLVLVTVTVEYGDEGDEEDRHAAQLQMIRSRPEAL